MKKYLANILSALIVLFGGVYIAQASGVYLPVMGGTGTGVIPTYGQVLVDTSGGVYTPTATSSLGLTFSTTSSDYWIGTYNKGFFFSTTSADYWGSTKGYATFAFPFTAQTYGVSTSTTVGFLNGLLSTASSTFTSTLRLSSLSNGELAVYGGTVGSYATTTAGTGLTYSGNAFNCNTANGSTFGCLSSTDWTTFNNKQATISATWPITLSGATVGFNGLSTTTNLTTGYIPYVTGVNTFGQVATGTITCTGTASCSTTGLSVIGGNLTINVPAGGASPIATSSSETAGNLAYWTSTNGTPATLGKVATTSLSVTSAPFSFPSTLSAIGSGAGSWWGLSTTSNGVAGNIPYWTGVNTIGTVATGSITCSGTGISCSTAGLSVIGGALTITGTGSTFAFPFTPTTNFGVTTSATSTMMSFFAGINASSTSNYYNQRIWGNEGVGTSTPFSMLSVSTSTASSPLTSLFAVASSTNATLFNVLGNGNVGISTTSPYSTLSVGGNVVVGASTAGGTLGDLYLPKLGTAAGTFLSADATGKVIATTSPSGGTSYWTLSGNNIYNNNNGGLGFVGIGTSTPFGNLSLSFANASSSSIASTSVYSTAGAYSFTAPANTSYIQLKVIGGGGGGGGMNSGAGGGGSGGGGGAFVSSSNLYGFNSGTIYVAQGGRGGVGASNNGAGGTGYKTGGSGGGAASSAGGGGGGSSAITSSSTSAVIIAAGGGGGARATRKGLGATGTVGGDGGGDGIEGGGGGAAATNGGSNAGGTGATSATKIGSYGGTSLSNSNDGGGGGGSAGGITANGNNGSNNSGSSGGAGGAGSNGASGGTAGGGIGTAGGTTGDSGGGGGGGTSSGNGGNAGSPGSGGGSGGGNNSANTNGGNGGDGEVIITFYTTTYTTTNPLLDLVSGFGNSTTTSQFIDYIGNVDFGTTSSASATGCVFVSGCTSFFTIAGNTAVNAYNSAIVTITGTISNIWYKFFQIDQWGHVLTGGPTPSVGTCGTSPTIAGNDTDFRVHVGSVAATACTVTFANAYTNPPICTVDAETGTLAFMVNASSTPTTLVLSGGTLTSAWLVAHCESYQ